MGGVQRDAQVYMGVLGIAIVHLVLRLAIMSYRVYSRLKARVYTLSATRLSGRE